MIYSKLDRHAWQWQVLTSTGIFAFFALSLAIPSGYSYGSGGLLLLALGYLCTRPAMLLSREDKALAYLLLSFFLVGLVSFLIHHNPPKTLDQSSRYLFFIPILILLLKIPTHPKALWSGLIVGALSALMLALWQRYAENNYRPDGFMTSAIPFGNLSLMAGVLCLAGVGWASTQRHCAWLWRIALSVGFLSGMYVSLLSGSRGGWLALPLALVIFIVAFFRKDRVRAIIVSVALVVIAVTAAGVSLREEIAFRYDAAVAEINEYALNGNASTSVGSRLGAWRVAIESIAERPLIGWSYKDYDTYLSLLAKKKEVDSSVTALANTHNNFLEIWLHQGLLGLLIFLALFIVPFWFFCKRLRSDDRTVQAFALGGACLLACFFVFSLTQVILGRNNGVIFFGLSLVIFWGCMRDAERRIVDRDI